MTAFTIQAAQLTAFGSGLHRPECVACTRAGAIWVSHASAQGGGVTQLDGAGASHPIVAQTGAPSDLTPNGWCMNPDGSFLLANLAESGGVWRLAKDGRCTPVLLEVDGLTMPSVNFVHRDREARVWVSLSTWRHPRDRAFHRDVADGCVILLDGDGARIVADGIGYTNEIKVDPGGQWLYVNETMARRLSRYAIDAPGAGSTVRLGPRQTVADYIDGVIPDGFEFDSEGGVWCASVMSNRVVRVAADGSQHVIVEDCDAAEIATGMQHWRAGTFNREHMNVGGRRRLGNVASVTFGGPDLKTVYLGSLSAESLFTFR
jgi:sugar lactone lactonase YvrE